MPHPGRIISMINASIIAITKPIITGVYLTSTMLFTSIKAYYSTTCLNPAMHVLCREVIEM